jgi:hypothetical protein
MPPKLARLALALVVPLAAAHPAAAISKCKIKVDKKTGELLASAKSVTNNPTWGPTPGFNILPFDDVAGCFQGGKLKSCRLGPVDSVYRTTPGATSRSPRGRSASTTRRTRRAAGSRTRSSSRPT